TYRIVEGNLVSNTATVSITVLPVNDAPFFVSAPIQAGKEGVEYSYRAVAKDVDDDTLTLLLTSSPVGMTLDQSGLITWLPGTTAAGVHSVSITAADAAGLTATQSYDLAIENSNRAPTAQPF